MRGRMVALLVAIAVPATVRAQAGDMDAVLGLVDRFDAARAAHDPRALADTLAPDYDEVSPMGEVDARDAVLGFYAPSARRAPPEMTTADRTARVLGEDAVVTARVSFTPSAGAALRSVRVRYVARRLEGGWKLVSAQYTPIPAAR